MPSETFSHRATTFARKDQVWAALNRPDTWEAIGGVDRVFDPEIDEQGRLRGFSFATVAGGKPYVGVARPHERIEGETIAWEIESPELRGVTKVQLGQNGGTTTIEVTLQVQSAGFLSSMFFPVIAGAIGKGLPRSVQEFAASFDT